jgi:D-inositol-3-phosphate glycosyltransferase
VTSSKQPEFDSATEGTQILYSFALRLGVPGIGTTAWYQVQGLLDRQVPLTLACGTLERPLRGRYELIETMRLGPIRFPYRLSGLDRAMRWHDRRVAWELKRRPRIGLVHCWPSAALRTLRTANGLKVATVLERPSAHTAQVYDASRKECERLGLELDRRHYGSQNLARLRREEQEFASARFLLCPSEFAARTFRDRGVHEDRIRIHRYGFDPEHFKVDDGNRPDLDAPLTVLYVGEGFPLKGLHFALRAWVDSGVAERGRFVICGRLRADYQRYLDSLLAHPSVIQLGFRSDVPTVMQRGHALVIPSLSEGSALVSYEAKACGLVLLASDASGARCEHLRDALVHPAGDVASLREHFRLIDSDRTLLRRLREQSLLNLSSLTWEAAVGRLVEIYQEAIAGVASRKP